MIFHEKVLGKILRFYFYLDHSRFLTSYSPCNAFFICGCIHLRLHFIDESKMPIYMILSELVLAVFGLLL